MSGAAGDGGGAGSATGAGTAIDDKVTADWENREAVDQVRVSILAITHFLNTFDASARFALAKIGDRLTRLERNVEYVEAAIGLSNATDD